MKTNKKIIYTVLLFIGLFIGGGLSIHPVQAATDDGTTSTESNMTSPVPIYILPTNDTSSSATAIPLKIGSTTVSIAFPYDPTSGKFDIPTLLTSTDSSSIPEGVEFVVKTNTNEQGIYNPTNKEVTIGQYLISSTTSYIAYQLKSYTPTIKFVDADGNYIDDKTYSGIQMNIGSDGIISPGDKYVSKFNDAIPEGYVIDGPLTYTPQTGDEAVDTPELHSSLTSLSIPLKKVSPIPITVNYEVDGDEDGNATVTDSRSINTKEAPIKAPTNYSPQIDSIDYDMTTSEGEQKGTISAKNISETPTLLSTFTDAGTFWSTASQAGITNLQLTVHYKEYDSPISNTVDIPSNLSGITAKGSGIPGQKITVPVPIQSGYTNSPSTITATVKADGTIVADDGQTVTYTKKPVSSSHSDVTYSNIDTKTGVKLGALRATKLYNSSGTELDGENVIEGDTFSTDEKMTRNGTIFYRVGDNKWIRATDVYTYTDAKTYVRTHSDTYKILFKADGEAVKNRALAAGSDWYSDRTATINGDKYYRVATDEWINATDVDEYQTDPTIINVSVSTDVYNDFGKQIKVVKNNETYKTDRTTQIDGKEYYRIATNEYVLASDVK